MNHTKNLIQTEKQNTLSAASDRLKRYLLVLLVLLPSLSIFSVLFFSNLNSDQVLLREARTLLKNTTSESIQHADAFLKNAEAQVSTNTDIFLYDILNEQDLQALENYYIAQLEKHADIAGLYSANREGDFFHVSRSNEFKKGAYRVKTIDRSDGPTVINVWWRNPGSRHRYETAMPDDNFDPRTRPWYKEAIKTNGMIWTDPYIFFTTQRLGVTTASPIKNVAGQTLGAIGVDLELTELAKFLSALAIDRYGSSFITTEDGALIASPALHEEYRKSANDKELKLLSIENTNNELTKLAYEAVFNGDEELMFEYAGGEYLVEYMPLFVSGSDAWLIVTYAEKNEFLPEIRNSAKQKYIMAMLITFASILLGWFFAKIALRPIVDLEDESNRDQLTQVFNRRYLDTNADVMISEAIDRDEPLSIAIIDIDHFKPVNDTYGHHIGDQVLKVFASRLMNQSRKLDLLARFGGEEFVLALPNTTSDVAKSYVDNARIIMSSRLYEVEGYILQIRFSAGIAALGKERKSFADILKAADKALYQAKQEGRNRVNVAPENGR